MNRRIIYGLGARVRRFVNESANWKNVIPALTRRTHFSRWAQVAVAGPPVWDGRNKVIAGFIPASCSVIDLGCGAKTLKTYLPDGCRYQPCDLVQSTPDVMVCDFNAGQFPKIDKRYDYAVCSGVLEYIRDHDQFLEKCCGLAGSVLLSYNPEPSGVRKIKRMKNSWINHFSKTELEALFLRLRIGAELLHEAAHGEVIYRLAASECGRKS